MTPRPGPSLTTLVVLCGAVLALHLGLLTDATAWVGPAEPVVNLSSATTAAPSAMAVPVRVTQVHQASHVPTAPPPVQRSIAEPRKPRVAAVAPAAKPVASSSAPDSTPPEAAHQDDSTALQMAALQMAALPASTPSTQAPAAPDANRPPPVSQPPSSVTLRYDVKGETKGFTYNADGTFQWRLDDRGYDARMELSMRFLGSRVQTSRGAVGPDGLRPERFADKRSSERAAHFDRGAGQIRFSNNAAPAALMPGAQDRLSLFMQLAGLLRAQPYNEGDSITFQVAGVSDAEPWRFEVGPMERLDLPAGPLEARRLTRTPRKPHDSTVEVWLAPSIGHLPVRLRVAQSNGDVADQRLSALP